MPRKLDWPPTAYGMMMAMMVRDRHSRGQISEKDAREVLDGWFKPEDETDE